MIKEEETRTEGHPGKDAEDGESELSGMRIQAFPLG